MRTRSQNYNNTYSTHLHTTHTYAHMRTYTSCVFFFLFFLCMPCRSPECHCPRYTQARRNITILSRKNPLAYTRAHEDKIDIFHTIAHTTHIKHTQKIYTHQTHTRTHHLHILSMPMSARKGATAPAINTRVGRYSKHNHFVCAYAATYSRKHFLEEEKTPINRDSAAAT